MGFYEEISKYYDYIFPVGKEQINFITKVAGEGPKLVLDIACGTGGYALELAKQGYAVTAVDLDGKMVEELKGKTLKSNLAIEALQGNMLELSSKISSKYDVAFCIGNSLVHLDGHEEIEKFFREMKGLLKEEGNLIIQIINYDRVLSRNVRFLPTIENKEVGLTFQRLYRYDESLNKVFFKTILEVEGKKIENEIPLYPALSEDLEKLLRKAGFKDVKLYGDFKGNDFDKDNSYALVLAAS